MFTTRLHMVLLLLTALYRLGWLHLAMMHCTVQPLLTFMFEPWFTQIDSAIDQTRDEQRALTVYLLPSR